MKRPGGPPCSTSPPDIDLEFTRERGRGGRDTKNPPAPNRTALLLLSLRFYQNRLDLRLSCCQNLEVVLECIVLDMWYRVERFRAEGIGYRV